MHTFYYIIPFGFCYGWSPTEVPKAKTWKSHVSMESAPALLLQALCTSSPDGSWFVPRQVATENVKALTREGHGLTLPLCLFNMHQEKGLKQMIKLWFKESNRERKKERILPSHTELYKSLRWNTPAVLYKKKFAIDGMDLCRSFSSSAFQHLWWLPRLPLFLHT